MDETMAAPRRRDLSQWFMLLGAVVMVGVPWWLGLLYIVGVV